MEPKDRIEEGMPPLDLEDGDPNPHWDMPFDDDEDDLDNYDEDIFDDLDKSDLY